MESINILIVEDDPIIGTDLEDRLTDLGYQVIGLFDTGEAAFAAIATQSPHLILMDINLAGAWDGIETAQKILSKRYFPIIFLTSNSDDATFAQAKKVKPAAFLSKPYRGRDLKHAIELAIVQSENTEGGAKNATMEVGQTVLLADSIFVKNKDRLERVTLADITWIEADDYYCRVHTTKSTILLTQTLSKFAEKIAHLPNFFRVHRSHIINVKHIEQIGELSIFINGQQIPLSKTAKMELLSQLATI